MVSLSSLPEFSHVLVLRFKAEISLSGFWSKRSLETRGLFGEIYGGFFLLVFSKEYGLKKSTKKIHKSFEGEGVLKFLSRVLGSSTMMTIVTALSPAAAFAAEPPSGSAGAVA